MRPPEEFVRIINRKRYDVSNATLLAGDDFWDGHNFERQGHNTFPYCTPNGGYFVVNLTQWQGEQDTLAPISQDDAIVLYEEGLSRHRVPYARAFPDVEVLDA